MPSFSKIFDFVKNGVTNSDLFCLFGGDKRARISLWLMTLALCRQAASSGTGSFFFLRRNQKEKRMGTKMIIASKQLNKFNVTNCLTCTIAKRERKMRSRCGNPLFVGLKPVVGRVKRSATRQKFY